MVPQVTTESQIGPHGENPARRIPRQAAVLDLDVTTQYAAVSPSPARATAVGADFAVSISPTPDVPITLLCSYADEDDDGIVDTTSIPETDLRLCRVSGSARTPIPGSETDTDDNTVRADVSTDGMFGLYAVGSAAAVDWVLFE